MNSKLRALHALLRNRPSVSLSFRNCSSEIVIPKRVPRGATDILKALSGCVGLDPTAPHYKFHDDPYLIPYSNPTKRTYALSLESGRKAAHWIRQQHSDLFQHKVADPLIEAFSPLPVYDENSTVNEQVLNDVILRAEVSNAITVYELLKKNGEVSRESKLNLLQLVCFYNAEDPLSEDWIEERWFRQDDWKAKQINFWKDKGFAEKLFDEIINSDGDHTVAYNCLLTGMLTYGQITSGNNLYEKMKTNGIRVTTEGYNALFAKAAYIKEDHPQIISLVLSLLSEMAQNEVSPNVMTMNSALESIARTSTNRNCIPTALGIVAEFKKLGLEPSLYSYVALIECFSRDSRLSGVVNDVLSRLEGQSLTANDPRDSNFFLKTMEVISQKLKDVVLARRLDELLHVGNNYNLIGDSYRESRYYRSYFLLLIQSVPLTEFMEVYDRLTPNVYVPEPMVMREVLKSVQIHMDYLLLNRVWTDLVLFEQVDQIDMIEFFITVLTEAMGDPGTDPTLISTISWSIWEKIENSSRIEWTGGMLGNVIRGLLCHKELSKATLVLDRLDRSKDSITGEPDPIALAKFLEISVELEAPDAALRCLKYCRDMNRLDTPELKDGISAVLNLPMSNQLKETIQIVLDTSRS